MNKEKTFRFFIIVSLAIVFALIFAGALVRSTGSGMGCPDWPKCFGSYIPPTSESQLPTNYKEIYKDHIDINEPFNAVKTWIEYINRLLGALTGIVVLGLFVSGFRIRMGKFYAFLFSGISLLLVFITAIVGKFVVSSNLNTGKINIHLILAFLLVLSLISTAFFFYKKNGSELNAISNQKRLVYYTILGFSLLCFQLYSGMNVRSDIEIFKKSNQMPIDETVLDVIIHTFPIHKTISLFITIIIGFILFKLYKIGKFAIGLRVPAIGLGLSILGQMLTGTLLYKFGFPAFAQPLHLLFASIMLGSLFYLLLFQLEKKSILN